jgi:hypothetical protein
MISDDSVGYECHHQRDDGGEQEDAESKEHRFAPLLPLEGNGPPSDSDRIGNYLDRPVELQRRSLAFTRTATPQAAAARACSAPRFFNPTSPLARKLMTPWALSWPKMRLTVSVVRPR